MSVGSNLSPIKDSSKTAPVWRHKAAIPFCPIRCERKGFWTKVDRQRGTNRRSAYRKPAATTPLPTSRTTEFPWQPLVTAHKPSTQWSTCSHPALTRTSSNKFRRRTIHSSCSEKEDKKRRKLLNRDFPNIETSFRAKKTLKSPNFFEYKWNQVEWKKFCQFKKRWVLQYLIHCSKQ